MKNFITKIIFKDKWEQNRAKEKALAIFKAGMEITKEGVLIIKDLDFTQTDIQSIAFVGLRVKKDIFQTKQWAGGSIYQNGQRAVDTINQVDQQAKKMINQKGQKSFIINQMEQWAMDHILQMRQSARDIFSSISHKTNNQNNQKGSSKKQK